MRLPQGRAACAAMVVVSLVAVAAAMVSQHVFGMEPCPWCVLQRVVFVAIAIAALPGLVSRHAAARIASGVLVLALALAGAAAALWQHFVAAASQSCAVTLADRLVRGWGLDELWPAAFSATASCADAAVKLLGVPYEFYSLALFLLLGWMGFRLLAPARPSPGQR
jgi:disulfide bond formation protein DsbB